MGRALCATHVRRNSSHTLATTNPAESCSDRPTSSTLCRVATHTLGHSNTLNRTGPHNNRTADRQPLLIGRREGCPHSSWPQSQVAVLTCTTHPGRFPCVCCVCDKHTQCDTAACPFPPAWCPEPTQKRPCTKAGRWMDGRTHTQTRAEHRQAQQCRLVPHVQCSAHTHNTLQSVHSLQHTAWVVSTDPTRAQLRHTHKRTHTATNTPPAGAGVSTLTATTATLRTNRHLPTPTVQQL